MEYISLYYDWRRARTATLTKVPEQHITAAPDSQKNFLVVDSKTETAAIEHAFDSFTRERKDIAILLINQHVSGVYLLEKLGLHATRADQILGSQIAERIRNRVETYTEAFPAVLEIPSKEHPYDPDKDSVLRRVWRLVGKE